MLQKVIVQFSDYGIDLFSLGGLFSHCRPRDDTLENSCFHILGIILGWIKEKFYR